MADLTSFRQLIADRASSDKGLPQVCLKCTTDFDIALSKLITVDNRQDGETDSQVASRYVDEICETLGKPENEEIVKKISTLVVAFKEKISGAMGSLHEIREHARELAKELETVKNDILAKDPFVSTHLKLTTLSQDYPVWEWAGPKLIGSATYIKERVGSFIVGEGVEIPTEYDYRLFLQACTTIVTKAPLTSVEMTEETKTTIIDSACEVLGEAAVKESVSDVIDVLVGTKLIKSVIFELKNLSSMSPHDLFNRIKQYDEFIQKYYPVVDGIVGGQIPLPEEDSSETLKTNAQSIKTICEFMAYFELMERETVFRQSILLQGGLMNIDEKSAYESAGGTTLMLAHYIRFMYKDDVAQIPARGISSKVIIESAAHNEKVVKSDISNIENRISIATINAKVTSFTLEARKYITSKVDREHSESTPSQKVTLVNKFMTNLVKKIANRIHQHDIAFVDAALMLIVEADYSGTFVEQMYNELGAAYLAKAKEAEGSTVTDIDIQVAEMGVVATMVANFITDQLIAVCIQKEESNKSPIVPGQENT